MRKKRINPRRHRPNQNLLILQIVILILALIILVYSRSFIATGASSLFDAMSASDADVRVEDATLDRTEQPSSAPSTDASHSDEPARE